MRPPAQDQKKDRKEDRHGHDRDLDRGDPVARQPGNEEIELGADQRRDAGGRCPARRRRERRGFRFRPARRGARRRPAARRGRRAGRRASSPAWRRSPSTTKSATASSACPGVALPWTSAPIRSAASQACPIHSERRRRGEHAGGIVMGRRLARSKSVKHAAGGIGLGGCRHCRGRTRRSIRRTFIWCERRSRRMLRQAACAGRGRKTSGSSLRLRRLPLDRKRFLALFWPILSRRFGAGRKEGSCGFGSSISAMCRR